MMLRKKSNQPFYCTYIRSRVTTHLLILKRPSASRIICRRRRLGELIFLCAIFLTNGPLFYPSEHFDLHLRNLRLRRKSCKLYINARFFFLRIFQSSPLPNSQKMCSNKAISSTDSRPLGGIFQICLF